MTDQQIAAVHGDVLHVPTVLGAVVANYNLPAPAVSHRPLLGSPSRAAAVQAQCLVTDPLHVRDEPPDGTG